MSLVAAAPTTLPQAALNGCSGCALHEATSQEAPEEGSPAPHLPCPLSAPGLLASLLVLGGEKEARVACIQYSRFKYFNPTLSPFQIARGRPCVLSQRELALALGNTQPLTRRLSPAANFSEPRFPRLNLGLVTPRLTPELRLVQQQVWMLCERKPPSPRRTP